MDGSRLPRGLRAAAACACVSTLLVGGCSSSGPARRAPLRSDTAVTGPGHDVLLVGPEKGTGTLARPAASSRAAGRAAAHATPGEVSVTEETGRVVRNAPGDADNDGYDERLGVYRVRATGPRVEVTLAPRGVPLPEPALLVAGLPPGPVLAYMEGRLVGSTERLSDGQLLIILPTTLARPVTANVRVLPAPEETAEAR